MKKLLFLFNPSAGKARIQSKIYSVVDFYTKAGYVVTVYPTQARGDGYKFIKEQSRKYDNVVCSGGDGTLNEVISGLIESNATCTLGYLPFGSTNDFARSIGIPVEFQTAMEASVKGDPFCIDVGKASDKYFIYVAAFGMFTDISYNTSQKLKNTFGYLAYILEGIKAITDLKSYAVSIEYEDKIITDNFIVGLVTNSMSVGGFKYPMQEDVAFNDGLFEILFVRMPQNILDLQTIIHSLMNEKVDEKHMVFIQTNKLVVRSDALDWTFDGEYGGNYSQLEIMNMQGAIKISVPLISK